MNCEYCNKEMPSSYYYEVGGVVECSKCFKERTMTPEEKLLARISDLEQQLAEAREIMSICENCCNDGKGYTDGE